MPTIAEALDVAWKHHQAGELAQAEQIYRQILQVQPANGQALHLLGLVALQVNMPDAAIEQFQKAIEASPSNATYHGSLGTVYADAGRYEEAAECFRAAIKYDPGYHDAYVNLGRTLIDLGQPDEALDMFHEALEIQPNSAEAYLQMGNALHEMGELEDAVGEYRQAIYHRPDLAQAHYNLGVALGKLGRNEEALGAYESAVRLKPTFQSHHNLALALTALGRQAEAMGHLQQALQLRPDSAESLLALANLLSGAGRLQEAAMAYEQALALKPAVAEAECGLGLALLSMGKLDEAQRRLAAALRIKPDMLDAKSGMADLLLAQGKIEEAESTYRQLIGEHPKSAAALVGLGIARAKRGAIEEAISAYENALAIDPQLPEAYYNMAVAQVRQGRYQAAAEGYRQAIRIDPEHVPALCGLGSVLSTLGRTDEAIDHLRQAIAVAPDYPSAYNNLGVALVRQGKLAEADKAYAKALELQPNYVEAYSNRAAAAKDEGRVGEALEDYREALKLSPGHLTVHSNLLMSLHYDPRCSPGEILAAARQYGQLVAERVRPLPTPDNTREPDRPLRVGFVSGDFRNNPVGYFFESLALGHDPRRLAMYCYANQASSDDLTQRLRGAVQGWHEIGGVADAALARLVRDDRIDILVDLAGHTGGNRLPLFALRPAPVQVSWLGYFGTTGLDAIDYVIGDRYVTPPDEEDHFVERIARLPASYLCFTPPQLAIDVSPLPAATGRELVFASFNNLAKINADVVRAWSEVLRAVPGSTLWLTFRSLVDERTRNRLFALFADNAVGPSRLRLEGAMPREDLLKAYRAVDIALDTFPFNGGTTTAEALWMGVPVVSLTGDRFVSHVGESILNAVGLEDLVTHSQPRYVARAAELAADLAGLARFRAGLRQRIVASPLCDGKAFSTAMEELLRGMWRQWCKTPPRAGSSPGANS